MFSNFVVICHLKKGEDIVEKLNNIGCKIIQCPTYESLLGLLRVHTKINN